MRSIIFIITLFIINVHAYALDDKEIFLLIDSDNISKIRKLVESNQITVDQKIKAEPYKFAPLVTIAARAASLKVLAYLIEKKADLNARTSVDETALMLASFFDDEMGDPNGVYTRHEKAVKLLVEAGAYLENIPEQFVPLAYAAYKSRTRIITYLLSKGANPNGVTQNGTSLVNTPLMMSVIGGDKKTTLLLLRSGADAKITNSRNATALELAKKNGKDDVLSYLECAETLSNGEIFSQKCE